MKIIWLGQAGLLFIKNGFKIMIDPYLSDSVEKINPASFRRQAVDESLFEIKPDVMIFTHNHLDHYDPATVCRFISADTNIVVLSPASVWQEVRKIGGGNNYIQFNRHTVWTENGIKFTAVKAEHSDISAIGVIIDDGDKKYYVTGDTLYNEEIFGDIPNDIYAVFLPVNGVGNNMNMTDAARFAKRINAERTVPMHIGMFDEITADEFDCENKIIANIYEEIKL
ncbi:MBL fold metallo-hydrolase [Ruminococcus sp.]|uniref:MBL fold metallo-hydrolase n=1 Tax=Ruminococcus sp. TaxID=41978 RepID=UPI002636692A|nr:MBL fold metallo-hydrolase [Ruminococcus sp.]MDD6988144.1 MBL fold metallo-hydrolase [Ruminococcus sp.]MDY6201739.1 MBL fold metallo-hydrolase [Ruminococcus sp.]